MTDQQQDARPDTQVAVPGMITAVPAAPGSIAGREPGPAQVIYADVTGGPGERRPVIPLTLRRENIRSTVTAWTALQWHRSRYHGLRFPLYVVAMLVWAAAGVIRLAARQLHWWFLLEQSGLRNDAAAAGDSREWRALHRDARQTRKVRGMILAAGLAGLTIAVVLLVRLGPWWAWPLAALAAVPLLARAGRPAGHRIIGPAVVPPQYETPTPEVITRALGALGIAAISAVIKDGRGITFVSPVMRDGPGWGVQIDLPHGVTASQVLARRESLASGLRRPLSATWPATVPAEHAGRLELWVGFHDITRAKPPRYPLAKAGTADVFAGLPFGTDPRQRPVTAPMFEVNWLIGASPGQGKTAAVRVLALGVALDVLADLWTHELAGKGDLEPVAQVSHRYVSGLDDDSIAYSAESAALLRRELERRSKAFGKLPKDVRPEGKITRELAGRGFRVIVATFDECQNLFMHPQYGAQAAEDLAYVIRLGRALGIVVILATQRPDKDSLPTAIRGIVTARFCLKVPDYDSNDMILGTGAYKAGYNAAIFRARTDAGLGWLKGDGDPQVIRTYYLDLPAAERIAARARAMRERAGVLSGYAAGLDDAAPARDVLADVLTVLGADSGAHWGTLADRLAGRWPDRWSDVTAESLSAQCRSQGVASVDVREGGEVRKGCRRVGLDKAAAHR